MAVRRSRRHLATAVKYQLSQPPSVNQFAIVHHRQLLSRSGEQVISDNHRRAALVHPRPGDDLLDGCGTNRAACFSLALDGCSRAVPRRHQVDTKIAGGLRRCYVITEAPEDSCEVFLELDTAHLVDLIESRRPQRFLAFSVPSAVT